MFPTALLTDTGFWGFSALYTVSVATVTTLVVWMLSRFSVMPSIENHIPKWVAILFTILIIEQFFHQAEHVTQMYQFQFLGIQARDAHGFVWFLDDEWNHFTFNAIYMTGIVTVFIYLMRGLYRAKIAFTAINLVFIVLFFAMEGWHIVEHTYRIIQHVQGLCDQCAGILDPLTGINRLVIHFWLNFFALMMPAVVYVWYRIPQMTFARFRIKTRLLHSFSPVA